MFTGIVEEIGRVVAFEEQAASWRLILAADKVVSDLAIGDSLACNGCCLTVIENKEKQLVFDLLDETVRLTSFHQIKVGDIINLERSLPANGRLGGHFVTGHIDSAGVIAEFEQRDKNFYLRVTADQGFLKYLVYKGSIALDGISLTVSEVFEDGFAVWLIPHTLEVTNLKNRQVGDRLNLEFDLLAKYVEKLGESKTD